MKEIEKYAGYYLLVYLIVLAFCGFFQYMYECQGQSLSCAFSKDGFNTIITTTAYVLTPVVAIIGFLNWKQQHNKLVLAEEAKKLLLAINDDIKLFTDIHGTLIAIGNNIPNPQICENELFIKIQMLGSNIPNVASKALILSELANDEKLSQIKIDYSSFIHNLHCELSDYFNNTKSHSDLLHVILSNHTVFFSINKQYKKLVKNILSQVNSLAIKKPPLRTVHFQISFKLIFSLHALLQLFQVVQESGSTTLAYV